MLRDKFLAISTALKHFYYALRLHWPQFRRQSCNGIGALAWPKTVRNEFLPKMFSSPNILRSVGNHFIEEKNAGKKRKLFHSCAKKAFHAKFSQRQSMPQDTLYLSAAQPNVQRLDFGEDGALKTFTHLFSPSASPLSSS